MMIWALCLFLSLKGALAQSDKKPKFGVFCPPDLYYPSQEIVCIHASGDFNHFNQLKLDLETSDGPKTLHTVVPNMPTWQCLPFQVPEPSKTTEKVRIVVQGIEAGENKVELVSKFLNIRKKNLGTFIQSDKPVYKAGQTINFRVVTINQDMEVLTNNFPLIELLDPPGNRLAQWKNVTTKSGIAEISYPLAEEPSKGKYTIKANDAVMHVDVIDYVLPRFDVKTEVPKSIGIQDKMLDLMSYGQYTYGETVQGNVTLKVCQKKRPRFWGWWGPMEEEEEEIKDLCHTEEARTDRAGKMEFSLDLEKFKLRSTKYAKELVIDTVVEEEGTGVKVSATTSIMLESQLTKLTFKDTKSYFMPGEIYRGKLLLTSFDGRPLASKKVYIKARYDGEENKDTFVSDSSGEITFELPTEKWGKTSVSLEATTDDIDEPYSRDRVSVSYGKANLYLKDIHVETKSYLYIRPVKSSAPCHQNVDVTVDYSLEKEEDNGCFELCYLVVLNGKIVQQGQKKVQRSKGDSLLGSVEFSLPIRDISPSGNLLVFIVSQSGAVVADTTTVHVTPCLKHAVNLKFSEEKVLPKSNVKLLLQANGGSLCALRAVDKSVVLMKPEAELSESKFQNLVKRQRTHIRSDSLDYKMCDKLVNNVVESSSLDTTFDPQWWYFYPEKKKDIQNIIQDMGVYVLSTWNINAPVTCKKQPPIMPKAFSAHLFGSPVSSLLGAPGALPAEPARPGVMEVFNYDDLEEDTEDSEVDSDEKPRDFFPETAIWESLYIPSSGSTEKSFLVPDTITEWSCQMFCVGVGGMGLSSTQNLKVFKPYFVELHIPYSVQRGETMELKASIFNYRSQETMIQTSLVESDQYSLAGANTHTFCLGAGQKKTVSWPVMPNKIGQVNISVSSEAVMGQCGGKDTVLPDKGNKDAVIKSLLVESEGTMVEQTHTSMLIVAEGKNVSENVILELPEFTIVDSARGFISITGDIMGSAMNNVDKLLTMSHGCGEQNMVKFSPNICVLQYLKFTGQLTDALLEKGKKFLEAGYQRQLMYKHQDGSYSAFGKSDAEGNTWLTSFVIRNFCLAQEFCFIDEQHIKQGLSFLEKQQKDNGCFQTKGRLLNNAMKGGVDDEVSLTAYIIGAFMECGRELSDPVVKKALQCIKSEPDEKASTYKLALKSYAYTLTNSSEECSNAMQLLDKKANKRDGIMYWSEELKADKESYWSKPKSADVEITGYVLMSKSTLLNHNIGDTVPIARWMCKQQNGNGGFISTQDTVVGLQSLAKFATKTSGNLEEVILDVTSEKGFHYKFLVNKDNQILWQRMTLPEVPGRYLVKATGTGTIFMQVLQRYNTPTEVKEAAFALSVQPQCLEDRKLAILLEFWYKGSRAQTNMVLLVIKPLSGYTVQQESIEEVKRDPDVKRVEIKDDEINIYVEEVTSEHQTLEIFFKRSVHVTGLKPANVKIIDYYKPEESYAVCYLSECA